MSYLTRAPAAVLSAAGTAAFLGTPQAAAHAATPQRVPVTREPNVTFAAIPSTPLPAVRTADARRHRPARHHHGKRHRHRVALPRDYAAWSKVAQCEEGGWRTAGGEYPDSIGINITNYRAFGGIPQPAGTPTIRQRVLQIRVADRLVRHYGIAIPDQSGCGAGW